MTLPHDPVQVRLHGRGGQGVVTAAELLGLAAFDDGYEVQAFPSFGSERMGAPVTSFCRLSTRRIRSREPIAEPDAVLVLDATLLHHVDVFSGLRPHGFVVINSVHAASQLGIDDLVGRLGSRHLAIVPATDTARQFTGAARPNVPVLAALAALTGIVSLAALERAVGRRFTGAAARASVPLVRAGYDSIAAAGHA